MGRTATASRAFGAEDAGRLAGRAAVPGPAAMGTTGGRGLRTIGFASGSSSAGASPHPATTMAAASAAPTTTARAFRWNPAGADRDFLTKSQSPSRPETRRVPPAGDKRAARTGRPALPGAGTTR